MSGGYQDSLLQLFTWKTPGRGVCVCVCVCVCVGGGVMSERDLAAVCYEWSACHLMVVVSSGVCGLSKNFYH